MESLNWDPGTLLETSGYYWKTCTLHAAVKLQIFTIIGSNKMDAHQINARLNGDLRGLTMLLNALSAMDLLEKSANTYSNSRAAQTFLDQGSDRYIGYMIMHHHHLMDSWHRMDQGILSGQPVRERPSFSDEQRRESFLMGMFNVGMATAPKAAEAVDLKKATRLLDLGGGPGTFAIHFCQANPGLTAAVYDLETTRPFAEKTIARFNLADRINFIAGDYTIDTDFDDHPFDAAWLSHILHGEGPEQAEKIIDKAVQSLKPGSPIFIHEFILDDTMDGPLFPALFSLNMFLGTPEGKSYSETELSDMLTACGVKNIHRLDFEGPTQSGILRGVVDRDP